MIGHLIASYERGRSDALAGRSRRRGAQTAPDRKFYLLGFREVRFSQLELFPRIAARAARQRQAAPLSTDNKGTA